MYLLERVTNRSDKYYPRYLDYFRILFGIFMFIKGVSLVTNGDSMILNSDNTLLSIIIRVASVIQISGGVLITIGLLTRLTTLFLIPVILCILLLSIYITNTNSSDVLFTSLVLLSSFLFLIEGSGKWSMDNYLKTHGDN